MFNSRYSQVVVFFRLPSIFVLDAKLKILHETIETLLDTYISREFTFFTHKNFKHEDKKFQQMHFDKRKL